MLGESYCVRLRLLLNVLFFSARSELIKREQGSSYTNVVRFLSNFGYFSFLADMGQTMMGGNTITVWYHPAFIFAKDYKQATPTFEPVMEIYYQASVDDSHVRIFHPDATWQYAVRLVIKNKDEIAAAIDMMMASQKLVMEGDSRKRQERLELIKLADNLKI